MKSGNLNFLEPSGQLQACNGTALPLPYLIMPANGRRHLIRPLNGLYDKNLDLSNSKNILEFDTVMFIIHTDVSGSNTEAGFSSELLVSTVKIIRYHNSEDLSVIRRCICMQMRREVLMFGA